MNINYLLAAIFMSVEFTRVWVPTNLNRDYHYYRYSLEFYKPSMKELARTLYTSKYSLLSGKHS